MHWQVIQTKHFHSPTPIFLFILPLYFTSFLKWNCKFPCLLLPFFSLHVPNWSHKLQEVLFHQPLHSSLSQHKYLLPLQSNLSQLFPVQVSRMAHKESIQTISTSAKGAVLLTCRAMQEVYTTLAHLLQAFPTSGGSTQHSSAPLFFLSDFSHD